MKKIISNKYKLVQEIATGGMGTVYRAIHKDLGRTVAIKLLLPQYVSSELFIKRFYREAKAMGKLHHPNIINILDVAQDGDTHYIAMEFVEGEDLRSALLKESRFTIQKSLKFTRQIASALASAHSKGIVHRDIKPGNIIISSDGEVKVGDFGLAQVVDEVSITMTGQVLGTPEYMSPEQAKGESPSDQMDLYSLGIVLYKMLTGTTPFDGLTKIGIIGKLVSEKLVIDCEFSNDIPEKLRDVVSKLLHTDLDVRYSSAKQLIRDLDHCIAEIQDITDFENGIEGDDEATRIFQTCPVSGELEQVNLSSEPSVNEETILYTHEPGIPENQAAGFALVEPDKGEETVLVDNKSAFDTNQLEVNEVDVKQSIAESNETEEAIDEKTILLSSTDGVMQNEKPDVPQSINNVGKKVETSSLEITEKNREENPEPFVAVEDQVAVDTFEKYPGNNIKLKLFIGAAAIIALFFMVKLSSDNKVLTSRDKGEIHKNDSAALEDEQKNEHLNIFATLDKEVSNIRDSVLAMTVTNGTGNLEGIREEIGDTDKLVAAARELFDNNDYEVAIDRIIEAKDLYLRMKKRIKSSGQAVDQNLNLAVGNKKKAEKARLKAINSNVKNYALNEFTKAEGYFLEATGMLSESRFENAIEQFSKAEEQYLFAIISTVKQMAVNAKNKALNAKNSAMKNNSNSAAPNTWKKAGSAFAKADALFKQNEFLGAENKYQAAASGFKSAEKQTSIKAKNINGTKPVLITKSLFTDQVMTRLNNFKIVYESKNLKKLKKIAQLSTRQNSITAQLFNNYEKIIIDFPSFEIVEDSNQLIANIKLTIVSLEDSRGNKAVPAPAWKNSSMAIIYGKKGWSKINW